MVRGRHRNQSIMETKDSFLTPTNLPPPNPTTDGSYPHISPPLSVDQETPPHLFCTRLLAAAENETMTAFEAITTTSAFGSVSTHMVTEGAHGSVVETTTHSHLGSSTWSIH